MLVSKYCEIKVSLAIPYRVVTTFSPGLRTLPSVSLRAAQWAHCAKSARAMVILNNTVTISPASSSSSPSSLASSSSASTSSPSGTDSELNILHASVVLDTHLLFCNPPDKNSLDPLLQSEGLKPRPTPEIMTQWKLRGMDRDAGFSPPYLGPGCDKSHCGDLQLCVLSAGSDTPSMAGHSAL
ncbi:hypothetical protein ACOMHN_014323 [Nucella lapillus]